MVRSTLTNTEIDTIFIAKRQYSFQIKYHRDIYGILGMFHQGKKITIHITYYSIQFNIHFKHTFKQKNRVLL
jgi:hypothetical protein